jgi:hypothetical protein
MCCNYVTQREMNKSTENKLNLETKNYDEIVSNITAFNSHSTRIRPL